MVEIYGLIDPESGELRYVGKARDAAARLRGHLGERRRQTPVYAWIKGLVKRGRHPEMFVIERVGDTDWREAESFWIAYLRFVGARLLNLAKGGDEPHQTREQRARAARAAAAAREVGPKARLFLLKRRLAIALREATSRGRYREAYAIRFHMRLVGAAVPECSEWAAL